MWQIQRIYLHSIGTPAARFVDVTLDLADGRGRPLDSILWLRNGGGKSTIQALVGALIRPARNDFLSAAEHRHDVGRHLEDYVLGSDTAHIAIEWGEADGRRLVTGAVYEWTDRVQPIDPNVSYDRLNQRWYSYLPDGDRAEVDRLPFKVAGRPTHQEAFCSAVRGLPVRAEPVVARTQVEWERTLTSRGIDPDLWRTILQMNEAEGGIEHQFLFASADEFVHYLLRLFIDPEIPNGVAHILGQVIAELAGRPDVEADLRFCTEAMGRLTELEAAWRKSVEASELAQIATADAHRLRASLLAAADAAELDALEAQEAMGIAQGEAARHRAASDVARDTANEYARLAAVLRERAADERIAELTALLDAAKRDRDAWSIAPAVVELTDLRQQRETLAEAVRAAEKDAAPLAARRDGAADAYGRGLDVLATAAREQMIAAGNAADAARAQAEAARAQHDAALRTHAAHEAAGRTARAAVERFDADLVAARTAGILGADETPRMAARRAAEVDAHDGVHEEELRTSIEATKAAVASDRSDRDRLVPFVERARIAADTAAELRQELVARRDALATDPRMALYLPAEDADLLGMGRIVRDSINDSIRRADGALIDLALDGADDERALAGIEQTSLLPPAPDLARACAVLEQAGISAVAGWTYLADAVPSSERRLAAFLAAPELTSGVLVQDPADLARARELLADAGLRATSLVALGTTAELQNAGDGPATRFVVPPNAALFDSTLASEERERREETSARRAEQRRGIEIDREQDRALYDRVSTLLAECPPERLVELDQRVASLRTEAGEKQEGLDALDARIREAAQRTVVLESELRTLTESRRAHARARTRLDALVATEEAVARDRDFLAELPQLLAAAKEAERVAGLSERVAQQEATNARLRAASLQGDLDRYIERRAELPRELAVEAQDLPDGWSLDVLASAWEDANAAWTAATSGSVPAQTLAAVERQEERIRKTVTATERGVVEHARKLLATPDGQSAATRARATHAATAAVDALSRSLGEAENEKRKAREDVESLEASGDRQRHRVVEEPATIEEARELERVCRAEQEAEASARSAAEERVRSEEKRETEARVRVNAFADQANTIEVTDQRGVHEVEKPFGGTVEEARTRAREVSRSLTAMRGDEATARRELESIANAIGLWAGGDEWATVKAEVRSRFRTSDLASELGPVAGRFRDEEIELRRIELVEHLRALDEHRANVVDHAVGMVRSALRSIGRFSSLSRLPEDLGAWSGQRFIEVGPRTPVDDSDAVMRDRVGRAVDTLIAQETPSIAGMDLLWRALREVVGPNGFRARVLKPSPTFSTERISVDQMRKWSGGEKVTTALLLFVTVAKMRAANRGKEMTGAGTLMLDNPLGKANYVLFLELQRRVAAVAGVQLVFLTGVADMKAVGRFPNVVRMRNAPDNARRRGYVQVTDRELHDETLRGRVDATRVYRVADGQLRTLV